MTSHPYLKAGKSKIHGKGLFAKKSLPKGTILWRWGKVKKYSREQLLKLADAKKNQILKYAFEDSDGFLCYCLDSSRFINHSCNPNMAPSQKDCRTDIAIKDIQPGEEITYDYAFLHPLEEKPMACRCWSKDCRRLIKRENRNPPWMRRLKQEIRKAEKQIKKVEQLL